MTYKEIDTAKAQEMYIDYINNFASVARFAEHYQLTYGDALKVIKAGRPEGGRLAKETTE